MEIICKTSYTYKAMTAMARGLRKTMQAKSSRLIHIFGWCVILICLLNICLNWGNPGPMLLHSLLAAVLVLIMCKVDALNGYFAKRLGMPGLEKSVTTFREDGYEIQISGAVGQWQYERILAIADTGDYFVFTVGKRQAQCFEKAGLEGATVEELFRFLEQKTGLTIQNV